MHREALWPLQLQVRVDGIEMSRGKLRAHEPDASHVCSGENGPTQPHTLGSLCCQAGPSKVRVRQEQETEKAD